MPRLLCYFRVFEWLPLYAGSVRFATYSAVYRSKMPSMPAARGPSAWVTFIDKS